MRRAGRLLAEFAPDTLFLVMPADSDMPTLRPPAGDSYKRELTPYDCPELSARHPASHRAIEAVAGSGMWQTGPPLDALPDSALAPLCLIDPNGRLPLVVLEMGGTGPLDPAVEAGAALGDALTAIDGRAAIVAVGELSATIHARSRGGYSQESIAFDEETVAAISRGRLSELRAIPLERRVAERERLFPQVAVVGAALGGHWSSDILSYQAPFGVGLLVAALAMITPG